MSIEALAGQRLLKVLQGYKPRLTRFWLERSAPTPSLSLRSDLTVVPQCGLLLRACVKMQRFVSSRSLPPAVVALFLVLNLSLMGLPATSSGFFLPKPGGGSASVSAGLMSFLRRLLFAHAQLPYMPDERAAASTLREK